MFHFECNLHHSEILVVKESNHSTAVCTSVVKEIIQYYNHIGSKVYACLLDASKAFERLHFGKLFKMLIERKLHAVITRILLESYINQYVKVSCNNKLSRSFKQTNGVKQGCVLSLILFSIYIHKLLKLLMILYY